MAKKAASRSTATKATKAPVRKAKSKPIIAKLTYTSELEAVAVITIMPGYTPADVLDAVRTKKADFYHEIREIELKGKVIATLKKPHLLNDEHDDFDIEAL